MLRVILWGRPRLNKLKQPARVVDMYATIQSRRCSLLPFAQPSPVSVGGIMCAAPVPNWRQLAEAASKETDHNKLLKIVGNFVILSTRCTPMNRALGKILPRRKHLPTEMVPNVYLPTRATENEGHGSKLVISVGTPPDLLSSREAVRNFYPHAPKLPKCSLVT